MRSTRATAAVERLKLRSGNKSYAMVRTAEGLFYLVLGSGSTVERVVGSNPLPLDPFVKFVDGFGPQVARRVTKNDLAFEAQLVKRKSKPDDL
jgi:hypothetical protein